VPAARRRYTERSDAVPRRSWPAPRANIIEGRTDEYAACPECARVTDPAALYTPRRFVTCPSCGVQDRLSDRAAGDAWRWEVVLVERAAADRKREFAHATQEGSSECHLVHH
jgi:hypothetical protein